MLDKLIDVMAAHPLLPSAIPILLLGSYLFAGYTYLGKNANTEDISRLNGTIEQIHVLNSESREDFREIRRMIYDLSEQRCQTPPTSYSKNTIPTNDD